MQRTSTAFQSAVELAEQIRRKTISARELLELYWDRVQRFNPALNAIVVSDIERARKAAANLDDRRARNEPAGALDGLPMTIKEQFDWAGTPSTWGADAFRTNIATKDAVAVERLTTSGAVVFGKTNVPFMLSDWQSFNTIYGTSNNPWDLSRSPGGSSGGAAAALAAGLTGLELGSDIGASIRNPAHYCGVYGHKPTYGVVPMNGTLLPGTVTNADISVGGPLARSAADLELAMSILAGPERIEARSSGFRLAEPRRRKLADFRVAVMLTDPESEVDRPVQDLISKLSDFLGPRVRTLSATARPDIATDEAHEVFIMLLRAATSRGQTDAELARNIERAALLDPADNSYAARTIRASVLRHRDWLRYNNRRHAMRLAWDRFFDDFDVLLCPAAASAAFPHDQAGERQDRTITVNGRQVPSTDQLFWAGYTCCFYLPATVAPIGLTREGLPVGVQIATAEHSDLTSIEFAKILEREYYGFVPPPGYA